MQRRKFFCVPGGLAAQSAAMSLPGAKRSAFASSLPPTAWAAGEEAGATAAAAGFDKYTQDYAQFCALPPEKRVFYKVIGNRIVEIRLDSATWQPPMWNYNPPPAVSTQIALIQALFQAHKSSDGLELARQVSAQAKNDVRPRFSLGILLAREKEYDAAVHELELADALNPGTPEILHNLGQAYFRERNYEKAEEVLKRALSLSPDSPDTFMFLPRRTPRSRRICRR